MTITRFFKEEIALWMSLCIKNFIMMHFFWSQIKGMYSLRSFWETKFWYVDVEKYFDMGMGKTIKLYYLHALELIIPNITSSLTAWFCRIKCIMLNLILTYFINSCILPFINKTYNFPLIIQAYLIICLIHRMYAHIYM